MSPTGYDTPGLVLVDQSWSLGSTNRFATSGSGVGRFRFSYRGNSVVRPTESTVSAVTTLMAGVPGPTLIELARTVPNTCASPPFRAVWRRYAFVPAVVVDSLPAVYVVPAFTTTNSRSDRPGTPTIAMSAPLSLWSVKTPEPSVGML
ncbi:Uncharacterised protein [Mycobacteroides abscessus subsp. abscessus]|nr:Uncharacterised protein [Mycobacteroides abscessus subsp. abscessus]